MTARNYDIILQFANNIVDAGANYPAISGKFESGNVVIGLTSGATGQIANIDLASNTFKVKLSNTYEEFRATENIRSIYTDILLQNSSVDYGVANTDSPASNNYPAISNLFENIAEARNLTRVETATDTFLLPIAANSNSEITAIVDNVQIHPTQYTFTDELPSTTGTISSYVTVGEKVLGNCRFSFESTNSAMFPIIQAQELSHPQIAEQHPFEVRNALSIPNEEQQFGVDILKSALSAPLRQMASNSGLSSDLIESQIKEAPQNCGYNFRDFVLQDMVAAGIVDPLKVTRCALQNAASAAGTLITTSHAIVER